MLNIKSEKDGQSNLMHVIVGAGAAGKAAARLLAESGEYVRLISRSGNGPEHENIEPIAADATDTKQLTKLMNGAVTLFNCAMPAYDRWPTDFPPLAESLLRAAEQTGANYVMLDNAYGYGEVAGPVYENLPMAATTVKGKVRAEMWLDALAAHRAGKVRVTEVRASDFLGAGAMSLYSLMVVPQILDDQPASYAGDLDVPHSWSYIDDVAKTLVAVSRDDRSWGRAWHVPSTSTSSVLELTNKLARLSSRSTPELTQMSSEELDRMAATDSIIAEIPEMLYLDLKPFSLDSTQTERTFGIKPTPIEKVLAEVIQHVTESA